MKSSEVIQFLKVKQNELAKKKSNNTSKVVVNIQNECKRQQKDFHHDQRRYTGMIS